MDLLVHFIRKSDNRKIGNIPCAMTERSSCPTSCSFYNNGCYAESGFVGMYWNRIGKSSNPNILKWNDFCSSVKSLPAGQIWRYGVAGDLPGVNQTINQKQLQTLLAANRGKRGWTYTHKPVFSSGAREKKNRALIQLSNNSGFTINISTSSLEEADRAANLKIGPVVVTVPDTYYSIGRTPERRRVIVCPAQLREDMTCDKCRLCADPKRESIIAFKAHSSGKKLIEESLRKPSDSFESSRVQK